MVGIFGRVLRLQVSTSHAMPDANDGPGHFSPLDIDQVEEVPRVVKPARCSIISIVLFPSQQTHATYDHFQENVH